MNMPKFSKPLRTGNTVALKGGSYSLIITAVVLAILIAANIFTSVLPTSLTKYDISSSKLYSITSNTKVVVNALSKDVNIYWIVQSGAEDSVIENLLGKYESLSEHISVQKKNPDAYPTFAQQYTDSTVQNNDLVVECGDKYRYISLDDIYLSSTDGYYSYTSGFDGEGAITSAIDYVVSEEFPRLYIIEGHGEAALPSGFAEQLEKENVETHTLSLLTVDEIPEDADALMMYGPASDISEEEAEMLKSYIADGGNLFVASGPVEEGSLVNLNSVLEEYNVTVNEGIVVDEDRNHYAFGYPHILMPDIAESEITNSLIENNYYAIMPISSGLTVGSSANGTVTELLASSYYSFNKSAGYSLTSYEREDGDTDGPFSLALHIEDNSGGQLVWFSSSMFLEDMYNAYSSGANNDMAMNAVASLLGETDAMTIRSKSLNYDYLTISDSTASFLTMLMVVIFPLIYLGIGLAVVIGRRRLNNE